MPKIHKHISDRWSAAKALRAEYSARLESIAHFFQPTQRNMWMGETSDRRTNPYGSLFDMTGVRAATSIANKAVARVIPKDSQYADIRLAAALLESLPQEKKDEWERELRKQSKVLHSILERGKFRQVMKMAAKDFLIFGHAAVRPTFSRFGGVTFEHFPCLTVFMEYSSGMEYSGVFWQKRMLVRDIRRDYPGVTLPDTGRYKDDEKLMVVFGFVPMVDGNVEFGFVEDDGEIIYYRELFPHERSIVAASYNSEGSGAYGIGFGAENLGEIQTLNQIRIDVLKASKLQATPMFVTSEGALQKGNVNAQAGGIVEVKPDAITQKVHFDPLPVGGQPSTMYAALEESRQQIREGFRMMPSAANPQQGIRTATEWVIASRQEQMENDEVILALRDEVVVPLIKQTIELLRQRAQLPEWLVADDATFKLELLGMEEDSKRGTDLQHLRAAQEFAAGMPPGQSYLVPHQKIFQRAMGLLNLEDIRYTQAEVKQLEAALQAQQEAQKQGGAPQ